LKNEDRSLKVKGQKLTVIIIQIIASTQLWCWSKKNFSPF